MSLDGALAIANSGLRDVDAQLAVISNNVANASTAGYSVETQQQTSTIAGTMGSGVKIGLVVRTVDLQQQSAVLAQNAVVSGLQTTQAALTPIAATQGTVGAGNDIASELGTLQDQFSTLTENPADTVQQSAVVDAASTLATGINRLAASYSTARQSAQDDIVSSVDTLNQSLRTIGTLNQQIVSAQADGQSTADLENLRDAAVGTIANLLDVKVLPQGNGAISLITSSGLSLPTPGAGDPQQTPFVTGGATVLPQDSLANGGIPAITLNGSDVTGQIAGGTLGADITLRDSTIPSYQAALDQFSETLANRFAGQGLTLFTDPGGSVPSTGGTPAQQTYVGFSDIVTVNPSVTADPALVRDGTDSIAGNATGASAFTPNPSGGPAGFSTLIDRVLDYTFGSQAQADVPYAAVPTTGLGVDGTLTAKVGAPATLGSFATALVAGQAKDLSQAGSSLDQEQAVQTTLNTQLQSSNGVDIDTELSHMVELQNAYGANARILSAIQSMFQELSDAVS